ncbi:MAG: DNA-binding protein [Oscillospiraceae bacterium]|nr:DNA-binding protein [Oscillospiraceae bacterium]
MEYRRFENTYVVRLDPGEEILACVRAFSEREGVKLASVQAIGALCAFTVGAFDTEKKQFHGNDFSGTYEITSLLGTINTMDGQFYTHLHMNAADETGRVVGGHLSRAVVSATCEMIVTLIPGTVDRSFSEQIGLNLLKF